MYSYSYSYSFQFKIMIKKNLTYGLHCMHASAILSFSSQTSDICDLFHIHAL